MSIPTQRENGTTRLVDAQCLTCGDVEAGPDLKCPRCGKAVILGATQDTLDRRRYHDLGSAASKPTAPAAAHLPGERLPERVASAVVTLPATRDTTRWVQQTEALVESLRRERQETEARIAVDKRRLGELDAGIAAIVQVQRTVTVPPPIVAVRVGSAEHPTGKRWSRGFDACVRCGKTDSKHASRGVCSRCAWHDRQDRLKAQATP